MGPPNKYLGTKKKDLWGLSNIWNNSKGPNYMLGIPKPKIECKWPKSRCGSRSYKH